MCALRCLDTGWGGHFFQTQKEKERFKLFMTAKSIKQYNSTHLCHCYMLLYMVSKHHMIQVIQLHLHAPASVCIFSLLAVLHFFELIGCLWQIKH